MGQDAFALGAVARLAFALGCAWSGTTALAAVPTTGSLNDPLGASLSKATRGPQSKVDSSVRRLQREVVRLAGRGNTASLSKDRSWRVRPDGAIQVYLEMTGAFEANVAALGASSIAPEQAIAAGNLVQVWLTPNQIDLAASMPFVRLVRLPGYAFTNAGTVVTEGDAAHRSDQLRTSPLCLDGDGVRVGIISDGINSALDAMLAGELPAKPGKKFSADITVAAGLTGDGDEGTAMLEIVHDLAPNAKLFFAGPETSADMFVAMNTLAEDLECHVVCDDLSFFDQPFFDDGLLATAGSSAVFGAGRSYVTSAGNQAQEHWQDAFSGVVVNNAATGNANWTLMDFDGAGDHSMDVTVPGNGRILVFLQWNDEFGSSDNDYELYVVDQAETVVFGSSTNTQSGTQNPAEFISLNNNGANAVNAKIWIREFAAPSGPSVMETFVLDASVNEYASAADAVFGHAAAEGVISVGAIDASDTPCGLEDFSNHGPSTVWFPFEERNTPTFVATDRVHVSGAGCFACDPNDCPPPPAGGCAFAGTSAAAPHIAGIIAQMLEIKIDATPADVLDALKASVTDCGDAGFDFAFGHGFVDAPEAAESLNPHGFACPEDLFENGVVDGADLAILLASWGDPGCGLELPCPADLNCDGAVNAADLGLLLAKWGACAG
jgi:hypothetical protein